MERTPRELNKEWAYLKNFQASKQEVMFPNQ
jgi:hypothetical protein